MNHYFSNLNETLKTYFHILSDEIPDFLGDYVDTPVLQKQAKISVTSGSIYSKMFDQIWYSSLDHSVAVALIIWHFTKDKKQTLAGLFHDISTPVFKHCVDFMNGDHAKQESTEGLTTKMIQDSKEIMALLKRDGIPLEEVCDYHIYPIADNDTPMLSSDRLEYTFSNGLGVRQKLWNLDDVKEMYNDIEIQKNENNIDELGFKTKEIAEKFVHTMSKLSCFYIDAETKFTMQFLADVMKKMSQENLITIDDLYQLSEKEILNKVENCQYANINQCFEIWKNAKYVKQSDEMVENTYCVQLDKVKIRYINPLVRDNNSYVRLIKISEQAKSEIESVLNFKTKKYLYLDFDFA